MADISIHSAYNLYICSHPLIHLFVCNNLLWYVFPFLLFFDVRCYFPLLAFLPSTSNIVTLQCTREPFSGTWSIDGNQIIASYTMMAMAIQEMMANLTSHPNPNLCTSLYFQLYLFSYWIFFSPQKVLTFTFFISIRNKGHACLVCGVKRRMCDALLPACLAHTDLPQTSNIIIYGTSIFPTLAFR